MRELSEHFNEDEFRCKCCGKVHVEQGLITRLEKARQAYGKPMHVVSGYRCQEHNKKVGGASQSYHCKGLAVDIRTDGLEDRFAILKACIEAGFTRVGVYQKGWHVDAGAAPDNVMWVE